jgi:hypothetical protein
MHLQQQRRKRWVTRLMVKERFLPDPIPEIPEHVPPTQRSEFEIKHGITYCRRCGRVVVNDRYPDKAVKPCERVHVGPRNSKKGWIN